MSKQSGKLNSNCWQSMIDRCYNPNAKQYKDYGGRGINVCKKWWKFKNFYADMGDKPENLTLERINNESNYCPENCKWATRQEQALNKRNKASGFYWNKRDKSFQIVLFRYNRCYCFGFCKSRKEAQYRAEVAKEALDAFFAIQKIFYS